MRNFVSFILLAFFACAQPIFARATPVGPSPSRQYLELRIYHARDNKQLSGLEDFLRNAYLPALHRLGIEKIGVFKSIENDTAADKKIYVLVPFKSFDKVEKIQDQLTNDKQYMEAGKSYLQAPYNQPQ